MTGHFFITGVPTEFDTKTFERKDGTGGTLCKFKIGPLYLQSFSETVLAVVQDAPGNILVAGEFRERRGSGQYEDRTFADMHVTAARRIDTQPESQRNDDLPF